MTIFRYVITITLFIGLISSYAYSAKLTEGEPVPAFVMIDENGREVNIDKLLVKPTIIYFTHNACHYCTQIIAMLIRAEKKFGNKDLQILGVNVMAKDARLVKAYKEELGFIFPMFAGNRSEILKAYKIYYVPKLVFIDRNKTVRKVVGHYIHEPELYDNIRQIMSSK